MIAIAARSMMLLALVVSCTWGTPPAKVAPANGPQGARVALRLRGETSQRAGELFAVDSVGVVIRSDKVVRVSWTKLDAMDVSDMGSAYDVGFGEVVTPAKRAKLAPLSRFPQGLSGALLRSVLATLGQTSLEEVR